MLRLTAGSRQLLHEIADTRLSARQGTARLAIIVNELLSNALKYGKGNIEVCLSVARKRATLRVL